MLEGDRRQFASLLFPSLPTLPPIGGIFAPFPISIGLLRVPAIEIPLCNKYIEFGSLEVVLVPFLQDQNYILHVAVHKANLKV